MFRGDEAKPVFKEAAVPGAFAEVLDFVKKLSDTTAGFIMSQVLAADGQVMAATVAPVTSLTMWSAKPRTSGATPPMRRCLTRLARNRR